MVISPREECLFASLYKNKHLLHIEVFGPRSVMCEHLVLLSIEAILGRFYVFFISAQEKISIRLRKVDSSCYWGRTSRGSRLKRLQASLEWKWIRRARELLRPARYCGAQHFTSASSLFLLLFSGHKSLRSFHSLSLTLFLLFCFVYA